MTKKPLPIPLPIKPLTMKKNAKQFINFMNDNNNCPVDIAEELIKLGSKSDINEFRTFLMIFKNTICLTELRLMRENNEYSEMTEVSRQMAENANRLNAFIKRIHNIKDQTDEQKRMIDLWNHAIGLN
mgnify:CR=1 FL=1